MPKKKEGHPVSGSAIAGSGAVVAGTGFVAGGVPGAKADVKPFTQPQPGVRGNAKKAKAFPGGVLGFRRNAHEGGIYGFKQKATANAWKGPAHDAHEAFFRGRTEGKIEPEEKVLRHLKGGKKAAGAAMAGGAAITAYGVHRARSHKIKKSKRQDKYNGALVGAGATTAGIGHGGAKLMEHQDKKWSATAVRNVKDASRMVPGMATPKARHGKPINTEELRDADAHIRRNPKTFKGVHPDVAQRAGKLRGAAVQQAHFADVYRDTGKMVGRMRAPGIAVAAAGAGGLAVSRMNGKKKVKKNFSAFGIDH